MNILLGLEDILWDISLWILDVTIFLFIVGFAILVFLYGCGWLLGAAADWLDSAAADRPATADRPAADRPRAVWLGKWDRIRSAAFGTARWRRPRLRRGRFALRPNRAAAEAPRFQCAVCARRPCVCNVVGVRAAVEQSASEGLGCERGFRHTFRGAGSGRRPAGF